MDKTLSHQPLGYLCSRGSAVNVQRVGSPDTYSPPLMIIDPCSRHCSSSHSCDSQATQDGTWMLYKPQQDNPGSVMQKCILCVQSPWWTRPLLGPPSSHTPFAQILHATVPLSLPLSLYPAKCAVTQERAYIEQVNNVQYTVKMGFVPNMNVPGTFYVNDKLKDLLFEELAQSVQRGEVSRGGGCVPCPCVGTS